MSTKDWISLGLSSRIKKFDPYEAICNLGEVARDVYFNLQGKIAVVMENRKKYTKKLLEEIKENEIPEKSGFGELGVIYGSVR